MTPARVQIPTPATDPVQGYCKLFALIVLITLTVGQAGAVPNYFVYSLSGGQKGCTDCPAPTSLYCDSQTGEIFVISAAANTITIFDRNGRDPFVFSLGEHARVPRQLIVNRAGQILILDGADNSIAIFDYNGDFLDTWRPLNTDNSVRKGIVSLAIDESSNYYLLSLMPAHVAVYNANRELQSEFDLFTQFDETLRETDLLGRMNIINSSITIPIPLWHSIASYHLDGSFDKLFGVAGGAPGELSHPIDVAENGNGGYLVLDKHRHCILDYDAHGQFVREFGGMGFSEGWFYHPISLVRDDNGNAIVAQGFLSRIQAVKYPDPISTAPTGVAPN